MSPPIGFLLVGPGKVAHTHAQAITAIPQARLVAVCGRNPQSTQAFATQYGAAAFTDLRAALSHPEIQAVVLCTPHPLHAPQAIVAAQAGKHVLIEKPMALTTTEADQMIETARAHRVKLGVISQRRLYEPVQRVKQAILEGRIGKPILGSLSLLGWRGPEYYAMDAWRGTWQGEGGGVLVNQAVHQLDLLLWLMDSPLVEVKGQWANLNHPSIEVEDTAVATLRFESGALGSLVVSNSQNPGLWGKVHIHGSNGFSIGVQTDGGSMFVSGVTAKVEPPFNDLWTIPHQADLLAKWQAEDRQRAAGLDVMTHYHKLQLEDFVQAIVQDREPMVSGLEGRKAVELFEAIYKQRSPQL